MKKGDTLFWLLRTLVRQGELRPAYARQIYQKYIESSGKAPFGHALWFNRGWAYDLSVFGSKKAAEDNTYCPVYKLPFVPGYDRRAGKAKIFGTDAAPSGKTKTFKKILKNIKKIVDTMRVYVYNIIREK